MRSLRERLLANENVRAALERAEQKQAAALGGSAVTSSRRPAPGQVQLTGVGYTHLADTPWARPALQDVTLTIAAGERLLVIGPNGSGKTTLAWLLAGLREPTYGTATLDDVALHQARGGALGLSFQHARLQLLRPTVAEDLRSAGLAPHAAGAALSRVGLDPEQFLARSTDTLSGGEQRRVALAGLLGRDPQLLVLDEPLAGVDTVGRDVLLELIVGLTGYSPAGPPPAVVMISHDVEESLPAATRVLGLDQGRVVLDEPAGQHVPAARAG